MREPVFFVSSMMVTVVKQLSKLCIYLAFLASFLWSPGWAAEPLKVGYLEQRPAPIHFSRAKQIFAQSVPGGVSWQSFTSNEPMLLALMEGSVDVVYGQSPESFAKGLSLGMKMHAVGIALVQISDAVEFVVASDEVINNKAEQLQAFMDVTEATNTQWRDTPDTMRPAIAATLGLQQVQSDLALDASRFPLALEQRDDNWMETRAIEQIEQQVESLAGNGEDSAKPSSYAVWVTLRFLR